MNKAKRACFLGKKKGSILAYSLIILSMMLVIAVAVSSSAILERKSAGATSASVQALQTADSGVQLAIKKINLAAASDPNKKIQEIFTCTASNDVALNTTESGLTGASFQLSFFKEGVATPLKCHVGTIGEIVSIKSIGTYKNTVRAIDVQLDSQEKNLYVTNYSSNTLNIFKLDQPDAPQSVSSMSTSVDPRHMASFSHYAYIANLMANSIEILNITNKNAPVKIKDFPTPAGGPIGVAVSGSYLFVSYLNMGKIGVFEINSATGDLTSRFQFDTGPGPYGMTVYRGHLYVANSGDHKIRVYDLATLPAAPVFKAEVGTSTSPTGLAPYGNYLYVTCQGAKTIDVYDISVPADPRDRQSVIYPGVNSFGVAVYKNYLYVAKTYDSHSIGVYDISDPLNPVDKFNLTASGSSSALNGPLGIMVY